MQSYLQYRRIGRDLEKHIAQYSTNQSANCNGSARSETAQTLPTSKPNARSKQNEVTASNNHAAPTNGGEAKGDADSIIVTFNSPSDPLNPQNWSDARKWTYTVLIGATGFIVSGAAAFDTPVTPQAAEYFGVSEDVALLSTTLYMIALGLGSLVSAPFSETVGRNPIYISCECCEGEGCLEWC